MSDIYESSRSHHRIVTKLSLMLESTYALKRVQDGTFDIETKRKAGGGMVKILVVDDDKRIVDMIEQFFSLQDMKVVKAHSGMDALAMMDETVDLVLLDVNMDQLSGMDVCKRLREHYKVPIVFLSANTTASDKILGLGYGADDYITKPFDPMELIARVKAHLRRHQEYNEATSGARILEFSDYVFNREAHRLTKGDQEIFLSATEFKLLSYLIDHPNVVISRKTLLADVWESEHYDENTVTAYVKRLREKIDSEDNEHALIKSIRGAGYRFEAEIRRR